MDKIKAFNIDFNWGYDTAGNYDPESMRRTTPRSTLPVDNEVNRANIGRIREMFRGAQRSPPDLWPGFGEKDVCATPYDKDVLDEAAEL